MFAVALNMCVDDWISAIRRKKFRESLENIDEKFNEKWCRKVLNHHSQYQTQNQQQQTHTSYSTDDRVPLTNSQQQQQQHLKPSEQQQKFSSIMYYDTWDSHPTSAKSNKQNETTSVRFSDNISNSTNNESITNNNNIYNTNNIDNNNNSNNSDYVDTLGMEAFLEGSCSKERFILFVLAELNVLSLKRDIVPLAKVRIIVCYFFC